MRQKFYTRIEAKGKDPRRAGAGSRPPSYANPNEYLMHNTAPFTCTTDFDVVFFSDRHGAAPFRVKYLDGGGAQVHAQVRGELERVQ